MSAALDEEAPLLRKAAALAPLKAWVPAVCMVAWLGLGVAAACHFEGWSATTACYVIVQIVTTVGYGDITVKTERAKLFCAFYVFFTILLLASFVTDRIARMVGNDAAYIAHKIEVAEMRMSRGGDASRKSSTASLWDNMLACFLIFVCFVFLGTCFFAFYESCNCSLGPGRVKNCIDGPECSTTGGYMLTWTDAFYMSVITLTTVGFGDHVPRSLVGQLFSIPWMLLGVVATGVFCSSFALYMQGKQKEHKSLGRVSKHIFESMDTSKSGTVSKAEFRVYALMKFGKVSTEELANIDKLFGTIDSDGSGQVTFSEISRHFD